MLAVRESEQVTPATPGSERAGRRAAGSSAAAPSVAAGAVQRCSVAGCGCGGTCAGHVPRAAATAAVSRQDPNRLERPGELPLDATLARAVRARGERSTERSGGVLARSSRSSQSSGNSSRSSGNSSSSGGGAGGAVAGGGAASPANCRVDVRATHIGGILSGAPIWHLLVVTTDATGTERYYRGGPGGPGGGPTYGSIITNDGLYVPGTVDWSPGAPSRTVMSGATACGHDACLTGELRRIDATGTAYAPTGPNSNTVASTILANCNIPRAKPVWIAPGWNSPAI